MAVYEVLRNHNRVSVLTPISVLAFYFAVVIVERFKVLVAVDGSARQSHVQRAQHSDIPEKQTPSRIRLFYTAV